MRSRRSRLHVQHILVQRRKVGNRPSAVSALVDHPQTSLLLQRLCVSAGTACFSTYSLSVQALRNQAATGLSDLLPYKHATT